MSNGEQIFSLVTTVLNDRAGVDVFLKCMSEQTVTPDEIVIVDGGSDDGTWELIQEEAKRPSNTFNLVVAQEIGCNVARGRDLAIQRSKRSIIVSTDVGCEWEKEWFEELIQPIKQCPEVDVVIGSWAVRLKDAKSDWARVEFARRWPFRLEATPESLGINRAIAYKFEIWERVGGYPQDLSLAADDVVFDMIIRKPRFGVQFAAAPTVRCYWERHEKLKQFCKEERRNFFGAGEARIWTKHFVLVTGRLLAEPLFMIAGILVLILSQMPWLGVLLMGLTICSIGLRIRSLWPSITRLAKMDVASPVVRTLWFEYQTKIWGMSGYIRGWVNGAKQCTETRRRLWGKIS